MAHATEPIRDALGDLRPLRLSVVESGSADLQLFNCLLRRYHYLGHRNTVGENLRYLARDRAGRPWAARCSDRPRGSAPRASLHRMGTPGAGTQPRRLTNNTAFWSALGQPHLASHLNGSIGRQSADWQSKYGHSVDALRNLRGSQLLPGNLLRPTGCPS